MVDGFKVICVKCGSDKILEKSGKNTLDWVGDCAKIGEGIQRKCLDCDNESFIIFKTWLKEQG